jgi:hypothetical protein
VVILIGFASHLVVLVVVWLIRVIPLLLRLLGLLVVFAIALAVLLMARADPVAGAADECEFDETHVVDTR